MHYLKFTMLALKKIVWFIDAKKISDKAYYMISQYDSMPIST